MFEPASVALSKSSSLFLLPGLGGLLMSCQLAFFLATQGSILALALIDRSQYQLYLEP